MSIDENDQRETKALNLGIEVIDGKHHVVDLDDGKIIRNVSPKKTLQVEVGFRKGSLLYLPLIVSTVNLQATWGPRIEKQAVDEPHQAPSDT